MNKNAIALLAVVVVGLGIFYIFSGGLKGFQNGSSKASQNNQNQIMLSISAKRFQFTPDTIRVKKGQKVNIIINNLDTTHGISLPDFNVSGNSSIEFTADKIGEFTFKCNTFCGDGHNTMQGKIIVAQ